MCFPRFARFPRFSRFPRFPRFSALSAFFALSAFSALFRISSSRCRPQRRLRQYIAKKAINACQLLLFIYAFGQDTTLAVFFVASSSLPSQLRRFGAHHCRNSNSNLGFYRHFLRQNSCYRRFSSIAAPDQIHKKRSRCVEKSLLKLTSSAKLWSPKNHSRFFLAPCLFSTARRLFLTTHADKLQGDNSRSDMVFQTIYKKRARTKPRPMVVFLAKRYCQRIRDVRHESRPSSSEKALCTPILARAQNGGKNYYGGP